MYARASCIRTRRKYTLAAEIGIFSCGDHRPNTEVTTLMMTMTTTGLKVVDDGGDEVEEKEEKEERTA